LIELFQHLSKHLQISEQAIKCQLDKMKRVHGPQATVQQVLQKEVSEVIAKATPALDQDKAAIERVERIFESCSERKRLTYFDASTPAAQYLQT